LIGASELFSAVRVFSWKHECQPLSFIMDYEMKGMTGAECTSAIRRLESANGSRLPVIGMTSNDSQEVKNKCLSGGMDAVLTKDCPAKDLLDILEPLLLQGSKT
jgi:CheY-like chemotaxis protein